MLCSKITWLLLDFLSLQSTWLFLWTLLESLRAAGRELWNSLPSHLKDADISYSDFRRSLKTFLFGQWGQGAVWTVLTVPSRNILTYLLTYLSCLEQPVWSIVWWCYYVGCCCSHQAMVKLLGITQRTNGDDDLWDRHFKAVLLILLDLMKDEDVS